MIKQQLLSLSLMMGSVLLTGSVAQATSFTVAVNTQSLTATTGALDFQFNPGVGIFQAATVTISSLAGGTYAGSQTIYGSGVSGGPLPKTISITNSAGQDNEILDSYLFSNMLTFTLNFTGPAITSPSGSVTAGSAFAFSIFKDAAGTIPALTADPNGIALTVNVGDQGSLTTSITSPAVTITPEPGTLGLLSAPFALLAGFVLRRIGSRPATA